MFRNAAVSLLIACSISFPAFAWAQSETPREPEPETEQAEGFWWTPWYLFDYALTAAGASAFWIATGMEPRETALWGPAYDPDNPLRLLNLDGSRPGLDETIGHRYASRDDELGLGETIPSQHVFVFAGVTFAYLLAQEGIYRLAVEDSSQRFHDTLVGFLESVALNAGATEIGKVFAGRLRPDFQDRLRRHLCHTGEPPEELTCADTPPLADTPEESLDELNDGRKSFPSGHASFGVNLATYTTLAIGGRWVWGPDTTPLTRGVGIAVQTMTMTAGLLVAGTRVDDGRHHASDVLVGAALGFGLANFSYWRRFNLQGRVLRPEERLERSDDMKVRLHPGPGRGIGMTVTF